MGVQVNMAVNTTSIGVPSLEKFSRPFCVSHGDDLSATPIESVVEIECVSKDEGQADLADGQPICVHQYGCPGLGLYDQRYLDHGIPSPKSNKQTHRGRSLDSRINEHKLAVRRRDPLSLVFAHALDCDHRFNWGGTEVVAMANTKRTREFLEAWYSNAGSINRHVDLDAHYEGLRARLTAPCPNATSTAANPATRSPIDPPSTLPLQHRHP
ncbi:hypothetical protein SprV_0702286000 [Sparganum proliferum]